MAGRGLAKTGIDCRRDAGGGRRLVVVAGRGRRSQGQGDDFRRLCGGLPRARLERASGNKIVTVFGPSMGNTPALILARLARGAPPTS
jgi:hypothetical protein